MLITPSNLNLFFTALETRFWQALGVAEEWSSRVTTPYPCETENWVSGWIGMLDTYREWIGPRKVRQPAPQTYLVAMRLWELTQEIDEIKLLRDQHGIYFPTVAFMGMQARKIYDYKVRDLIFGAGSFSSTASQLGTDGTAHWGTAHPVDFWDASKGTYANDARGGGYTENGQTIGGGFGINAFNSLWSSQAARKSESGETIGIVPDLSMFPPQLRGAAMAVIQNSMFAPPQFGPLGSGSGANAPFVGAMDNPLKGWTDILINPDMAAYPTDWLMLTTKAPIKPFSLLTHLAPDFVPRVSPTDPVIFNEHKVLYGSRAIFTPAWSLPFLSSISSS